MHRSIKLLSGLALTVSLSSLAAAITVNTSIYTGTQAYPIGSTGFCEVSSLDEIVFFSTPDNNSLADYFYAGITDSTGTVPRGVTSSGAPNLGSQQGNSLYSGDQSVTAIVLQSDMNGPNGPTTSNPWYWTIWEGTANDPNAFYNSGTTRGAIIAQIPIADSTWDNPPAAAGSNPCRPVSNVAPIANAGVNSTVTAGSSVTLDGSGSTDPDNDTLTYLWTQISGTPVTLSDAASVTPTFTAPTGAQAAPLIFQLVVNDGTVSSVADTVSLTINNGPVADAGLDQANLAPGTTVVLDGTNSSDADGDTLTYLWTQLSGPSVTLNDNTSATPSFAAPRESGDAPIVFQLVVSDDSLSSAPDTVSIEVIDNVVAATAAIKGFLSARNTLLLTHQPDSQRRIDRLNGRTTQTRSTIAGIATPTDRILPGSIQTGNDRTEMKASLGHLNGGDEKIDIWGEAYLTNFTFDQFKGDFNIYYVGVDYMLGNDTLLGMMAQFDNIDFDANAFGLGGGDGWMVGPYLTHRLDNDIYIDARAAWGQSNNEVSPLGTYSDEFETSRFLLSGAASGEYDLSGNMMIRPELGIHYVQDKQKAYIDSLGSTIPSQKVDQGQIHLAPRIHYEFKSASGLLRPYAEAKGIYSFGDNIEDLLGSQSRLRLEGGLDVLNQEGLRGSIGVFKDGIGASSYDAEGFHFSLSFTFQ